jgi:hypothetical protein
MHELSKTGRWLGGVTPTGYTSVSVESVTVDGKTKKACMLGIVPKEAEMVKFIFANFLRNNSLTKTETLLLNNGYKTKNNKLFTRFTIKNILTNPVYMTADKAAYHYLRECEADLFAEEREFDGKNGIMTYNRTIQKPGKTTVIRPINEWIVAVGKHEALVSGADWVKAQEQLGQNSIKSYRKPRSNTALLSGLLFCGCGDYMRPKLSKRKNSQGELVYTYLCTMKEKSRMHNCQEKNINGNMLDAAVFKEVKRLSGDDSKFMAQPHKHVSLRAEMRKIFSEQLEMGMKQLESNRDEHDESIKHLRSELAINEKEIAGLVSVLANAAGTPSEGYIMKQIEELHNKSEAFKSRINELEGLTANHALSDSEFDSLCQLLNNFSTTLDLMEIEQKRAALRSIIRKIVWDGEKIHVYFFGAEDNGTTIPQGKHSK